MIFKNECPSCRALEKLVESVKIWYANNEYGCNEIISYNKQHEHVLIYMYEPCLCPHYGYDFKASSKMRYAHYFSEHSRLLNFFFDVHIKKGMKYLVLQETFDKTIVLFNCSARSSGNMASITQLQPQHNHTRRRKTLLSKTEF